MKPEDLVAVASAMGSKWEELAARLAPVLFSIEKTQQIKKQNDTVFTQSRAMLEEWASNLDRKATNGALIAAMLKMSMKTQANKIFGEKLVEYVDSNSS